MKRCGVAVRRLRQRPFQ